MKTHARPLVALILCELLVLLPVAPANRAQDSSPRAPAQHAPSASGDARCNALPCYVHKPYLDLFQLAPHLEFTASEIAREREALKRGRQSCTAEFKERARKYNAQMEAAEKQLKQVSAKASDEDRHNMHCNIQSLRAQKSQAELLAGTAIPVAYQNMEAKLELIQRWPARRRQILAEIKNRSYLSRQWGDVKDIGFREIAKGQENDVKTGQKAVEQMRRQGLMPHDLENKAVQDYVNEVAQRVAQHSDLHIPLHVTVLDSKEINAFALPGGYLFVERGLLEAADDESELAGVLAHEISHDVARHAHKLMVKATIADAFFQGAQVAAVVLTGGVAGIGTLYAIQYGFYGLGMVLDLKLLGVSREYELQADQLGIQYAWNTGYDPNGFIRFFDKIASKEGYINGVSWFRTHPPLYERMVSAEREIMFLPPKPAYTVQTSQFEEMKKQLEAEKEKNKSNDADKPSLLAPEKGCPAAPKADYKPDEPIEKLCGTPPGSSKADD